MLHVVVQSSEKTGSVLVQLDEKTIIEWQGLLDDLAYSAPYSSEAGKLALGTERDYLIVHGLRCRPWEEHTATVENTK